MDHYEFLVAAERKYAIALGHYEIAEHAIEPVFGLQALEEADLRIQARKRRLRADMDRIAGSIRRLCDPEWTPGHIRPLRLKKEPRPTGEISKRAYRIMRQEQRPMGSRELAKLIASQLGLVEPDHRALLKIDVAVRGAFKRRVAAGQLIQHDEKPMRWSIRPPAERVASASGRPRSSISAASPPG